MIRIATLVSCAAGHLLVAAPARAAARAAVSAGIPLPQTVSAPPGLFASTIHRAAPLAQGLTPHPLRADSAAHSHRRATIVGGAVGALVGGLSSAAYILNATAYRCVTIGPPCPYDPHTGRRVVVIVAGTSAGALAGAWIGHRLATWRGK